MMDIVERLRAGERGLEHEAVSEIEALRAQLQEALKWRDAIDDAYTKWRMPIPDLAAPADVMRRLIQVEVENAQPSGDAMTTITRAEFDALVQKVEEIHRMLKNWGGQPNVVMVQPYPMNIVTCGGSHEQQ
jgi:hypothetical protein